MKYQVFSLFLCLFGVSQCQQTSLSFDSRIAGGNSASPGQFPFQAAIFYNQIVVCTGQVINEQHILTISSCVHNLKPSQITVGVGNINIAAMSKFGVKEIIGHKKFKVHDLGINGAYVENDVAVLKLNVSINIPRINRANSLAKENTTCTISGWGRNENNAYQQILRFTTVKIMNFKTCKEMYKKSANIKIEDTMICATGFRNDTCEGDFGAPLVCDGTLQGMASFGSKKCGDNFPRIYTSIPSFHKWISKTAGASSVTLNSILFIMVLVLLRSY